MSRELLVSLELKGLPLTTKKFYGTMRGGRRYKTLAGREYQAYVIENLRAEWHDRPKYTGYIELRIIFTSENHLRWDLDNRLKAIQDCLMLSGVINDDSQVQILYVKRDYGEHALTRVEIYSVSNE